LQKKLRNLKNNIIAIILNSFAKEFKT